MKQLSTIVLLILLFTITAAINETQPSDWTDVPDKNDTFPKWFKFSNITTAINETQPSDLDVPDNNDALPEWFKFSNITTPITTPKPELSLPEIGEIYILEGDDQFKDTINVYKEQYKEFKYPSSLANSFGTLKCQSAKDADHEIKFVIGHVLGHTNGKLSFDEIIRRLNTSPYLIGKYINTLQNAKTLSSSGWFKSAPKTSFTEQTKSWFFNLVHDEDLVKQAGSKIFDFNFSPGFTGINPLAGSGSNSWRHASNSYVVRFPSIHNKRLLVFKFYLSTRYRLIRSFWKLYHYFDIYGMSRKAVYHLNESKLSKMEAKTQADTLKEITLLFSQHPQC